jgi:hypothetical protein
MCTTVIAPESSEPKCCKLELNVEVDRDMPAPEWVIEALLRNAAQDFDAVFASAARHYLQECCDSSTTVGEVDTYLACFSEGYGRARKRYQQS